MNYLVRDNSWKLLKTVESQWWKRSLPGHMSSICNKALHRQKESHDYNCVTTLRLVIMSNKQAAEQQLWLQLHVLSEYFCSFHFVLTIMMSLTNNELLLQGEVKSLFPQIVTTGYYKAGNLNKYKEINQITNSVIVTCLACWMTC